MKKFVVLFVGSLIAISMVTAGKSDIFNHTATELWMSREYLKFLIDASYNIPQCVNIFIRDKSAGTERIFKEFLTIYPFEYTLNSTFYGCNCYFVISTSVETFLPTIDRFETANTNVEALIVIDDFVEEPMDIMNKDVTYSSRFFNASQYLQANVKIAARNGLWTLTENFMFPRTFRTVSRYDELLRKRGFMDFGGRELHALAFYNPPFCFLQSTINRTVQGVKTEFFVANDESELDGVEMKLFLLIASRLNFTFTIEKPTGPDEPFGRKRGNVWKGGLIGNMSRGEADIAFGSVWLTARHNEFVNMTAPWTQIHTHFLVPRPKPYASFWALVTPLSAEAWTVVFAMVIAQSICIYTRAWVNPHVPRRIRIGKTVTGFRSFTNTWTEMMARLLGVWAPRKNTSLELGIQLWHYFGVLIVTAYSCDLAARLASRGYDKRIDTLQDFISANLTWGTEGPVYASRFDPTDPYGSQLPGRCKHETSQAERHEKIFQGNYAIIGRLVSTSFFPDNNVSYGDFEGYRLMRDSTGNYYTTFVVAPWLMKPLDELILRLQESGLVQYHLSDVLYRHTPAALREVFIEYDVMKENARVLELTPLCAAFSILVIGLSISTTVFYFELRSVRGTRPIGEVLLDIKKNREIWQVKEVKRKKSHSGFMTLKQGRYNFDDVRKTQWFKEIRRPRDLEVERTYIP